MDEKALNEKDFEVSGRGEYVRTILILQIVHHVVDVNAWYPNLIIEKCLNEIFINRDQNLSFSYNSLDKCCCIRV